jgi:transcriptional regulatory protein LevR
MKIYKDKRRYNMNVSGFVKERDEAMLSLNKEKIMNYMRKYNVQMPKNELVFWAGIHKSILCITTSTEEQK